METVIHKQSIIRNQEEHGITKNTALP